MSPGVDGARAPVRILGIGGSTRRRSSARVVLGRAPQTAEEAGARATLTHDRA